MKVNIGISEKNCKAVVEILNGILADEHILYVKTRNYHWNVTGPRFHDLHKFFEEQYEALSETIDEVAERSRSLGGRALGTLSEFIKTARLKEQPGQHPNADGMIKNLLADHEALAQQLRSDAEECMESYQDAGTNDFLVGLMEQHEKMAWMLRSFLDGKV
jgi:starvation-inducible DNA-binding protein